MFFLFNFVRSFSCHEEWNRKMIVHFVFIDHPCLAYSFMDKSFFVFLRFMFCHQWGEEEKKNNIQLANPNSYWVMLFNLFAMEAVIWHQMTCSNRSKAKMLWIIDCRRVRKIKQRKRNEPKSVLSGVESTIFRFIGYACWFNVMLKSIFCLFLKKQKKNNTMLAVLLKFQTKHFDP